MKYGELPKEIRTFKVECKEMMFYQYLPIKLDGLVDIAYEPRLDCFSKIIDKVCLDFIREFGYNTYKDSFIYITAKYLYQPPNYSFNRTGYHSDGFLTNDINYIWCDKFPTVFNHSDFNLSLDDSLSMNEMSEQALEINEFTYPENTLLRLNQYNIHKVSDSLGVGMRTFLKVSFSKDKYDLLGNSHNYLLDYNWEMKERKVERNIPQSNL